MATIASQVASEQQPVQPKPRDFRQEVTDNIVEMLEKGVAPWQKPWEPATGSFGMPMNPTTNRAYRGGNAIHLIATAMRKGYDDPRWLSYKQAEAHGWHVRRGEKGTQIEFWDKDISDRGEQPRSNDSDEVHSRNAKNGDQPRWIHRVYTVFNAKQIEGVSALEPVRPSTFKAVRAGEQILKNSGAAINHDQADRAFYSRTSDAIHLPPKHAFRDANGYYGTALHELAHWSGHPSRLNRATLNESYRFGDVNYAKEELRAELASVFLSAQRGIPHNPEQHISYVGSWIKALKEDKNEIFRAAHDASKAADFLLALEHEKSIAETDLVAEHALDSGGESAKPTTVLEQETEVIHQDRERLEEQAPANVSNENRSPSGSEKFKPGDKIIVLYPAWGGQQTNNTETPAIVKSIHSRGEMVSFMLSNDTWDATRPINDEYLRHATAIDLKRYSAEFAELESRLSRGRARNGKKLETETAKAITADALGEFAKTVPAQTQSGNYRGVIIGETNNLLIQRQSAHSAITHPKELLDRQPSMGESVRINYSNSKGSVRECREHAKATEVAR